MIIMATVAEILEVIQDLTEDNTVPKNIKDKLNEISSMLKAEDEEISLKVNKALHELDDIAADSNMQPYTRTQLLGIASALESVE